MNTTPHGPGHRRLATAQPAAVADAEPRQWTQELRFNGQVFNDRLDFTAGGFYFDQEGTLQARVDLNYVGIDFIHGPDATPANSKALFPHTEFHLTEGLSFVGGVRCTEDYKDYTYYRSNPDLAPIPGPPPRASRWPADQPRRRIACWPACIRLFGQSFRGQLARLAHGRSTTTGTTAVMTYRRRQPDTRVAAPTPGRSSRGSSCRSNRKR